MYDKAANAEPEQTSPQKRWEQGTSGNLDNDGIVIGSRGEDKRGSGGRHNIPNATR